MFDVNAADVANSPLSALAASCNKVADNVPVLIQLLEKKLSPEEICVRIGECSGSNGNVHAKKIADRIAPKHAKIESGVDGCDVCKEVVVLAEGALAQNKTEQEIEDLLHELCDCEWWSLVVLIFAHLIT
jgi:hypothetical protein